MPNPPRSRWLHYGVIALALALPSAVTWLYFVALAGSDAQVQQAAYACGKAVQFTLPIVWVYIVQRRKPKIPRPQANDVALGVASGAAIVAAMLVLYFAWPLPAGWLESALQPVRAKVAGLGLDSTTKFVALALFYALVHSLLEEYYWRWFVFGELRRAATFWPAACLSSLGFMAHHVILLGVYFGFASPLTYLFSFAVAVGGLIWAWLYQRSGALYGAWVSHLLVDAGIFFIGWTIVRQSLA